MSFAHTAFDGRTLFDIRDERKKICFLGIGGIGMSALAEWCHHTGIGVYGYDRAHSENTERLSALGISVTVGEDFCVTEDTALAVATAALSFDDRSVFSMEKAGVPILERSVFLSAVASLYEKVIAVAGTHGKSTTTSMLASILSAAGVMPTVFCGAVMHETQGPLLYGERHFLVVEACEYQKAFLHLCPTTAVVLSTERDHPDTYADDTAVRTAYKDFIHLPTVKSVVTRSDIGEGYLYSHNAVGADLYATDVVYERGCATFTPILFGRTRAAVRLRVPGKHNLENACAAYLTAYLNGIPVSAIEKGLCDYRGIARRMEYVGDCRGASVYIDYAHHPTEITAAIACMKQIVSGKVFVIFEAHTYSRTYAFYPAFLSALSLADFLFITDIFAARETDTLGMSGKRMARDTGGVYVPDANALKNALLPMLSAGDAVLFLGAGNFFRVSRDLPLDGEGAHLL